MLVLCACSGAGVIVTQLLFHRHSMAEDAKKASIDFSYFLGNTDDCSKATIAKQRRSYSSIVTALKCCPFSSTPTRFLFVANCGGSAGVDREQVLKHFNTFGTIADLHFTQILPFCLIEFATTDGSKAARAALHLKCALTCHD